MGQVAMFSHIISKLQYLVILDFGFKLSLFCWPIIFNFWKIRSGATSSDHYQYFRIIILIIIMQIDFPFCHLSHLDRSFDFDFPYLCFNHSDVILKHFQVHHFIPISQLVRYFMLKLQGNFNGSVFCFSFSYLFKALTLKSWSRLIDV